MSQLIKLENNLDIDYSDWHKCVYEIRNDLLKLIGVKHTELLYELVQMRFNILYKKRFTNNSNGERIKGWRLSHYYFKR